MKTADKLVCSAALSVAVMAVATFAGLEYATRHRVAARAAAEPWREAPTWQGTKFTGDSLPVEIVSSFASDPVAPDERKAEFAFCLKAGSKYPCRGWYGRIESVTPIEDGWEVTITVRANTGRC